LLNIADRTLEDALQYRLQYEAPELVRGLYQSLAFHLQTTEFSRVEPRGFEPLTSAVQKPSGTFQVALLCPVIARFCRYFAEVSVASCPRRTNPYRPDCSTVSDRVNSSVRGGSASVSRSTSPSEVQDAPS
jgi:hypothetical protein